MEEVNLWVNKSPFLNTLIQAYKEFWKIIDEIEKLSQFFPMEAKMVSKRPGKLCSKVVNLMETNCLQVSGPKKVKA